MKLIYENNKYIANGSFNERNIPKEAGFRWDPKNKIWYSLDPKQASTLIMYADQAVKDQLQAMTDRTDKAVAAFQAVAPVSPLSIIAPEGLHYLPYQHAAIEYAHGKSGVLIADEPGLGKTIEVAGIINADTVLQKVLIICPASLKLNWQKELKKWLVRDQSVGLAKSGCAPLPDTSVVIINYDIVKGLRKQIDIVAWDLMVCDESHYLKNSKALRTQSVLGGKSDIPIFAKKRIFLTGTPIVNKPIELWSLIHSLDPTSLGANYINFGKRYCGGYQQKIPGAGMVWDMSGASNLSELQEKLRSSIMIRRLKAEVLTELPPKRRQIIEIPVAGAVAKTVKAELAAWEEKEKALANLKAEVKMAKAKAGDNETDADYLEAIKQLKDAQSAAFNEISKIRHETAVSKIPFVIDYLRDALESSEKIVLFAHHHDVIEAVAAEFKDICVTLTGQTAMPDRQAAVERFQVQKSCRLFIGSIGAAGTGHTLTAASHVVFAELDWVPGNMTQAEDRCHRIGQQSSVLVQHLVLDGSLDAKMAAVLVEKQQNISAALDQDLL